MKMRAFCINFISGLFLTAGLLCPFEIKANETPAGWSPSVTERLVKLPQSHFKKSVDRDFARSNLAQAITNNEENIRLGK